MDSWQTSSACSAHIPARIVSKRWLTEKIADMSSERKDFAAISAKWSDSSKTTLITGEVCAWEFNGCEVQTPLLWFLLNYRGFEVTVVVTVFCWVQLTCNLIYGYQYLRGNWLWTQKHFLNIGDQMHIFKSCHNTKGCTVRTKLYFFIVRIPLRCVIRYFNGDVSFFFWRSNLSFIGPCIVILFP